MGRAALTFAEIFIVLGLIFIIQMVANFNIYEGTAEVPPPDFVMLRIRQIPSSGSDADHIKYMRFSATDSDLDLNLQIDKYPLMLRDIGSFVDDYGACRKRDSSKYLYNTRDWKNKSQRELFVKELLDKYKISLNMVEVSNAQNEYILSWSPADIPEGATLTVAIEHCFLHKTKESTRLDPAWKVEGNSVPYPHPLIFERTEFRESIDVKPARRVMAHFTQFHGKNDTKDKNIPSTIGPKYSGYAFSNDIKNCNATNEIVRMVRKLMVREVNITLGD